MKVTKDLLRKLIKEQINKVISEDASDDVLRKALKLFPDAMVDEQGDELVVDTGMSDEEVEAMAPKWLDMFPGAEAAEGGLIMTGVNSAAMGPGGSGIGVKKDPTPEQQAQYDKFQAMSQQEKDARSDKITAEITAWLANNKERKAQGKEKLSLDQWYEGER